MKPNPNTPPMMMHKTLSKLSSLRLETMAQALEQQLTQCGLSAMSFEERLAIPTHRNSFNMSSNFSTYFQN